MIGGWSGFNGVTSCEVFDLATATWSFIADLHSGELYRGQSTVQNCVGGHVNVLSYYKKT